MYILKFTFISYQLLVLFIPTLVTSYDLLYTVTLYLLP